MTKSLGADLRSYLPYLTDKIQSLRGSLRSLHRRHLLTSLPNTNQNKHIHEPPSTRSPPPKAFESHIALLLLTTIACISFRRPMSSDSPQPCLIFKASHSPYTINNSPFIRFLCLDVESLSQITEYYHVTAVPFLVL